MIVAGHQPNFMPFLGFFDKMIKSDFFVYVDHVQYRKKQWQNRNRVRTRHGSAGWTNITVPVYSSGRRYQRIVDVNICNQDKWGEDVWHTIYYSYKNAPYFDEYADFFEDTFTKTTWNKLTDLNIWIIEYLKDALGIEKTMIRSSDYRFMGKKTWLLIEMCQLFECDTYLSGSGRGTREYVKLEEFERMGLKHRFQEFNHPVYHQMYKPFVPNMSAVDLLFNHGEESGDVLRGEKRYTL